VIRNNRGLIKAEFLKLRYVSFANYNYFSKTIKILCTTGNPGFAECRTRQNQALSKGGFAECQPLGTKKIAECLAPRHSAKFFKKNYFFCRVPTGPAVDK
jgi:hypothetical protein